MAACTTGFNLFFNAIYVMQQRRNVKYRLSYPSCHGPCILQCPVGPARHACVLSPFSRRRNESSSCEWVVTANPKSFQFGKTELSDKRARGVLTGRSAEDRYFSIRPSMDSWAAELKSRSCERRQWREKRWRVLSRGYNEYNADEYNGVLSHVWTCPCKCCPAGSTAGLADRYLFRSWTKRHASQVFSGTR